MSTAASIWLSARAAAKRAGTSVFGIQNHAICGRIRTRVEPGKNPKYHVEDVDRLATDLRSSRATA